MKKLLVALFIIGISLPSFAGIKNKDVVGKWKYKVQINENALTGTVKFEVVEDKLIGKVTTDDGDIFPLTKVEIRENNQLYFELQPESAVMKATVTFEGKKFEGTISFPDGTLPLSGEKIE